MSGGASVDENGGLYKSDKEIARLVGVGYDTWLAIAATLEKTGLPRRNGLFCQKRYWPAVRSFLDRREGLGAAFQSSDAHGWKERFDD